jgi:microcystin-dependent protein
MSDPYIGEIRLFGFRRIPSGWQACDGSLLSIAQYDALYTLLGTTYGGDGQTTFGVPDLRGRVPIHQGQGPGLSSYAMGQMSGTETVTLTSAQMAQHTHSLVASTTVGAELTPTGNVIGATADQELYVPNTSGQISAALDPSVLMPSGGSQPHENCMPTLVVNYCIATEGLWPSQN